MYRLEGKSIFITGGGSGIGAAASLLAAERRAKVTIADIDEESGERVAEKIREMGGKAVFVRTDISNEADVRSAIDIATSTFGALHGAFNNAGLPSISHRGSGSRLTHFADMSLEDFSRSQAVNIIGTFLCMKYEIVSMLEGGGGAIVNTSSGAGILAIEGAADYVAGKHAIVGLSKAAALDYATRNIRVNAVLPGITRTPMVEASFQDHPHMYDWAAAAQPNKRMGHPKEVAEAALWLLSDAASLVTGISMPVDGGYSMV